MNVRFGTAVGRGVVAATVLGSGIAFLDGTVVNVALPAIADDFNADIASLQWTIDAYLVTLTALLLLGGSVGDRYGHKRVYLAGLIWFTLASVACAAAPNVDALIVSRAVQGIGAAFLVPGSLAIIGAVFVPEDRSRAIGAWSGLSGVATAIGPFLGGWLVDAATWRFVFLINVPLAFIAVVITLKYVPETRATTHAPPDIVGAVLASAGLAVACFGLIEEEAIPAVAGLVLFVAFLAVEARSTHPMLHVGLFKNRQFSGANATTFAVYAALGGATFLLVLELQLALGYSALEAGLALLPVTVMMLLFSARAGALSQRIGPRWPMTIGPMVVGLGMLAFIRVEPGSSYFATFFPAAVIFGAGLALTVAPLTSTVLAAAGPDDIGIASGVNNAVARLAGLVAVAVLPAAIGLETTQAAVELSDSVDTALLICAIASAVGGVIAFLTVRTGVVVEPTPQGADEPCRANMAA